MRVPLVVGNWKMNLTLSTSFQLLDEICQSSDQFRGVDVVVCPPFPYLLAANLTIEGTKIGLGAQDVASREGGAYTGQVSAAMLADCGCGYVIVGHSERRRDAAETDALVAQKVEAALSQGLIPIVCVGESSEARTSGKTFEVIGRQLSAMASHLTADVVLAYEPIWAIGTGQTATPEMAEAVHAFIRKQVATTAGENVAEHIRIVYGGSVTAQTAGALFAAPHVDGGLVGGASLKASEFIQIILAAM